MKPLKKSTAKFLIIFVSILLVIGLVFAFIPMNFGNSQYLSFMGNIRYANDIKGGMYAEYKVSEDATSGQLNKTVTELKSILSEQGYPNAFVASIGDAIRVEIGLDTGKDYEKTQTMLQALGVGVFELRTGTEEDKTFINGREHIKNVTVGSSGGATYVQISFNKEGLELYKANMKSGTTIYVYMGNNVQTSFSGSTAQTDDMYLTFEDYAQAEDFALKVKLGSLVPIDFIANETVVNSMSSPYSTVGLTANINSDAYGKSNAFVAIVVALAITICATIIYMAIRYKAFGIINIFAFLCDIVILVFFMQALPWIELSLSSMLVIALGFALLFFGSFIYIEKVRSEFFDGKTLTASLESGYKKSILINSAIYIAIAIFGFTMAILGSGAIQVAGVLLVLFALIGALNNIVLLPGFVNIFQAFNADKTKVYGLTSEGKTDER